MDDITKKNIGERLSELRKERELTQLDVAEQTGIQRTIINYYECGARKLKLDDLLTLSDFYKVSTDYLLCKTDIKTNNEDIKRICEATGLSENAVEAVSNHLNTSKRYYDYQEFLKSGQYTASVFMPEYYEISAEILNTVLTSSHFWNIIFNLTMIKTTSNHITKDFDIIYIYKLLLENDKTPEFKEMLEKYMEMNTNIDIYRYSVIKNIEKISDLFDIRNNEANYEKLKSHLNNIKSDLDE